MRLFTNYKPAFIMLLCTLGISLPAFAQPAIQWQKSLGGSGTDIATCVRQTSDNGYIVAGYSESNDGNVSGNHGGYDYWIVKLDKDGNIQWQKSLGGSGNDEANSIRQTDDNGYIVAGYSNSTDGDVSGNQGGYDYWIVKLDENGNIQWQKSLGGTGDDKAADAQEVFDDDGDVFIVAGQSNSTDGDVADNHGGYDAWFVKLDDAGNTLWATSIGGSLNDIATSIQYKESDDEYLACGSSDGHDNTSDAFVIKLYPDGSEDFEESLGGSFEDVFTNIQSTPDSSGVGFFFAGGTIMSGYTKSNNGDVTGNHLGDGGYDYWIVKLEYGGGLEWAKCFGGTGIDGAFGIWVTADSGYVVAGQSTSNDGDVSGHHGSSISSDASFDYWLTKLDASGNLQWQSSLGGTGSDYARSIQQTIDDGYIVAGYSASNDDNVSGNHGDDDYWIVKLASDVLPVSWLNFDGTLQNDVAVLRWATAGELNNQGFEVQKSRDGKNFTAIGFVPGHGNSKLINSYTFSNAKVLSGPNYYRLKQIDYDNKFSYSSIIQLNYSRFAWNIMGNPVSNNSWVQLQLDKTSNIQLQIFSINGHLMQITNKGKIPAGTYSIPIHLSDKSAGIYVVKLIADDKNYEKKIIKQ